MVCFFDKCVRAYSLASKDEALTLVQKRYSKKERVTPFDYCEGRGEKGRLSHTKKKRTMMLEKRLVLL